MYEDTHYKHSAEDLTAAQLEAASTAAENYHKTISIQELFSTPERLKFHQDNTTRAIYQAILDTAPNKLN